MPRVGVGSGIAPGSPALQAGDFFRPSPRAVGRYTLTHPTRVGGWPHLEQIMPVLSQPLQPPPLQTLWVQWG